MGITKIFSSVDVMRPPKTTIAIGLWISLPGLSPLKTKGMSATAEVRRTANTPPISAKGRLTNVGFRDLNITVNEGKRWLCVTARK